MKVLFISSSFEDDARSKTININSHYPMGLAYLHAFLEKYGHTVHTLFLNDYSYADCRKIVLKNVKMHSPDVVGFNIITQNRTASFRLIHHIHKNNPHIRILIGGIHTTVMYKQILKRFPYIIAVLGEGEITAKEILEKIHARKSLRHVDGIAYVSKRKIIKTKNRVLITDLDTLPFPKHEVFFSETRTIASMITSRGCPFHCSFCVLNAITRGYPRKRSVQNVIAEIEYLIATYPQLETIWFHDDQFFLINSRVIEFCNEIFRKKIKLKFICSGRFKPISKEMVEALEKAGFIQVLLGLESGSPKILDLCHKFITHEDVIKAMTLFKNSKIIISTFLIVGLYGETDETVEETIRFVQRIQRIKYLVFVDIGILLVYPGTEIYSIAKKRGFMNDSYWLTEKPTPFFTVEHSQKQLEEFKKRTLDSIAIGRILTPSGFPHQYYMIPWIIKFLIAQTPRYPLYAGHILQRFFPSVYLRAHHLFNRKPLV
ncbi:hypothetical protein A2973_00680 [Candidatus Gottesmanbacteria bacterium RIFCSPLOWO2_01_FULL_49_10]|uniref:Uncharacterized protein n=1 Tax=Candidatus Gottesmanbacteria bacterium RIFCSPLOWO2_01_FULL_49_10 TaxID=1798396 RepID=A0A1F6AWN4_9BACT|nr:MAG: hypothetical protein A2973_00680 [Candidatus Gottesmanbacteria bacterium RIFCSPLOWO2_01_FULL_49_10]